ncbi:hypothetical protein HYX06_03570 [Candidatus Woesearchaeota archaeon]|nr:hypothetical protein [Candidatus Woesearchaeota archaeon]
MRFNKKASLEISIQAIVIVVLAMTLLGLGLSFIRKQFGGLSSIQEEISEQVKQKILDDLIENDKKLSFSRTELEIDKGKSEVLTIGIRNKKDDELNYKMQFTGISDPDGNPPNDIDSWFQYAKNTVYKLPPADSSVRNVRLTIPSSIPKSGSYFLNFEIVDDDTGEIYDSKDFFIVVRG